MYGDTAKTEEQVGRVVHVRTYFIKSLRRTVGRNTGLFHGVTPPLLPSC